MALVQQQHSTCVLPDGAVLAYEVLGSKHLGNALPLVLVCGMAMSRADWVRLSTTWAQSRPVLVYDHRGIGDSTSPPDLPAGADKFTMETLARDLAFLIGHLEWKEAAFFGFSMGGVVTQQMLVLPYHPTDPTPLSFRPTHVILGSTRAEVLRDPQYGLRTIAEPSAASKKPPTNAQRYESIRRTIESTVDPTWMKTNGKHLDFMIQRVVSGSPRSLHTISRQKQALQLFDFAALLEKLPPEMHVLVLHGQADQIIPFECSQEIVRRIPSARFVEIGPEPGKLPTLQFGHNFTLYFPVKIWGDLIGEFLRVPEPSVPPDPDFSATSTKENLADLPITEPPATKPVASEPPPNIRTDSPSGL
ncbi:Alpha/Beta hydrolase protein [Mycena albidolilacea]|uniref:Alpha/Beta hydrolase protein n=1 Tax=Mycena albidolilacea TaxID=1033008 RepID=A0AAD6Z800_9AGAR|nr:Alpha/Beta hydrolase protein [Mycena albidolilacea]